MKCDGWNGGNWSIIEKICIFSTHLLPFLFCDAYQLVSNKNIKHVIALLLLVFGKRAIKT